MGKIIDISHHQEPSKINYNQLAKEVDLVIIRTQYGSNTVDKHYKTHHAEFKKRGVPTNAYAWVRGVSVSDMEKEASDFYNRTNEFNPEVWWLDVEERSMNDMRGGVSTYVKKLRNLGAKKVGIYIAHHLYKSFNLNLSEVDAVWIPRYGTNNGQPSTKPDYPCCLWQYTENGKSPGYNGNLDLNMLNGNKTLDWFTGNKNESQAKPILSQPQGIGVLTVLENTVIRNKPVYLGDITGAVKPNEQYIVHDFQAGWFNIGGWVSADHVQFIPHNDVKMTK